MRIHIRIKKHDDPMADLEVAGRLRRDLWAHSPVEIDPDDPDSRTFRNENGEAFFEFETGYEEEVDRIVRDYGYADSVRLMRATRQGLLPLSAD